MRFVKIDATSLIVINIFEGATKPENTSTVLYVWSDAAQIGDQYDPNTGIFYKQSIPYKAIIARPEFIARMPSALIGRLYAVAESDYRVLSFVKLSIETWYEVDLNSEYIVNEINYIATLKDRKGFLLLPAEKAAIFA